MDLLAIAQIALTAKHILGKANHANFSNDTINEVKTGLDQIALFCQNQHEALAKQETEDAATAHKPVLDAAVRNRITEKQ